AFALVLDWRLLELHRSQGLAIDPEFERQTRRGLRRYGKWFLTEEAKQAIAAGLDQVGVLESSRYPSLHPGYLVVFSGVYRSLELAQDASARARDRGYADAYAAQVAR
ncbi:MAG: hypothetical protein ACRDH5_06280, partial [bacterium]